jgi:hypothetical protein
MGARAIIKGVVMQAENHDQGTGSGTKTENYQCDGQDGTSRLGSFTSQSTSTGNDANSVFDTNSTCRDRVRKSDTGNRKRIAGGILRQLRELQQAHLAYVKAHEKHLEVRLKENQKHQRKIAEDMQKLEKVILQLLQEDEIEE